MGREIRRVPPNWQHPTKMYSSGPGYAPMLDETFEQACADWDEGARKWDAGEDSGRAQYGKLDGDKFMPYSEWHGERPDDPSYYRTYKKEDATWYQLWETVSEGTPVSPPFATLEDLAQYLATNGDDWDQRRGHSGWGIHRARAFCADGWAPSFAVINGKMYDGTQLAGLPKVIK